MKISANLRRVSEASLGTLKHGQLVGHSTIREQLLRSVVLYFLPSWKESSGVLCSWNFLQVLQSSSCEEQSILQLLENFPINGARNLPLNWTGPINFPINGAYQAN